MKKEFSTAWKASAQPRKQRKYRYNAHVHLRQKMLSAHLSQELRKKHGIRSLQIRSGDEVKILRGQFKGKTGKIDTVDRGNLKVTITKIEVAKKDGTKAAYPMEPSNLMITSINDEDKKRLKRIVKKAEKPVVKQAAAKPAPVTKPAAAKPVQPAAKPAPVVKPAPVAKPAAPVAEPKKDQVKEGN